MAGFPCRDSCLAVVRFWESDVCLSVTQIYPEIHVVAWTVVAVVVDSDDGDEAVAAHCSILDPEAAVAFLDRSSPTYRRRAVMCVQS
jgi:hypothetical protein